MIASPYKDERIKYMYNFNFHVPTNVYFGEGELNVLPNVLKDYSGKYLLVYGGTGIKNAPFWPKILDAFKGKEDEVIEFAMEPNPQVSEINRGVDICRKKGVKTLVAVGGGSAIDTAKLIAGCYSYEGNAWDIISGKEKITSALPIIAVSTVAATGSEMDKDGVIINKETKEKISCPNPLLRPAVAILDPTLTYSVPKRQTSAGTIDIMSHVFEQYFTHIKTAYIQDRLCEAILKTCIKYGPIALNDPENYEARSNLMWAAPLALCDLLACGKAEPWTVHVIEANFCARFGTTHGEVLAVLTPYWMDYALREDTAEKFAEYGINVWGLNKNEDFMSTAKEAIQKTRDFFDLMGAPKKLSELGITEDSLAEVAKVSAIPDLEEAFVPMGEDDILNMLKKAY